MISTSTAPVYALTLLGISTGVILAYFFVAFALLYIGGWAVAYFVRPILRIINRK